MYKVDRDMDGHYPGDTSYQSKCHRAGMSWRKCKRVYLELTSISLHVSHFHKKKKKKTYIHQYPLAELLQKAESDILVSPHTANRLNEASIGHVSLLLQLLPGQNTGVGSRSLLQGIFPTQGSNPGLPHCRRMLYQLSHRVLVYLFNIQHCVSVNLKFVIYSSPLTPLVTISLFSMSASLFLFF